MNRSKVKLNICGTSYTINSDDTEEYMYLVGDKVDKKIKSILEKNPKLSTLMAAELAALEYCDLLNKSGISIENLKKQLDESLKELSNLKETLDIKNLELDDTKTKLKDCESKIKELEEESKSSENISNNKIVIRARPEFEVVENDNEIFADFINLEK